MKHYVKRTTTRMRSRVHLRALQARRRRDRGVDAQFHYFALAGLSQRDSLVTSFHQYVKPSLVTASRQQCDSGCRDK